MDNSSPLIDQLKLHFVSLDTDNDGYIDQSQLQNYMAQNNFNKSPYWMMTDAMITLNHKMSQENFITWILGCRAELQNLSLFKFDLQKTITKLQSNAGPPEYNEMVKKSFLEFYINKQKENIQKSKQHNQFLKIQARMNKNQNIEKIKQICQVLKRDPNDIFLFIKIRTQKNGQEIAQQFQNILSLCIQLASQLGPSVQMIIPNLNITCKYHNNYVYIIIELNHTFLSHILQYVDQAFKTLSPNYKVDLQVQVLSNFSKILEKNYDYLSESMSLKASLEIDKITLERLKQKLVEDFNIKTIDQKVNVMFLFLLEEIKLSSCFSNLKQFFQSLGFGEQLLPKPIEYAEEIKKLNIRQLIGSFLPEGDKIIVLLEQSCKPEGQISLFLRNFNLELNFKILIQGLFKIF